MNEQILAELVEQMMEMNRHLANLVATLCHGDNGSVIKSIDSLNKDLRKTWKEIHIARNAVLRLQRRGTKSIVVWDKEKRKTVRKRVSVESLIEEQAESRS